MEWVYVLLPLSMGVGVLIGKLVYKKASKKIEEEAQARAEQIMKEALAKAETLRKEKELAAKEKFLQLKAEFDEDVARKKNLLLNNEAKLKQKEQNLNKIVEQIKAKEAEFKALEASLQQQSEAIAKKREEAERLLQQQIKSLERIAGMTAEEAKAQLMESLRAEAQTKASSYIKDIVEKAKITANREAKKIIIEAIQRTATDHTIENCVSVFPLESDELKGKIIGREGRNIRALEAATGVEIIVDDTPEAVVISGFDPVRREVARLSLHRLVQDGRIHPARIEEVVAKVKKQIEEEIVEIGERAAIELGIHGLHPELIKLVGRMRFRSSYGQNLLQHSKEVAQLCGIMAAELGLNAKMAKRAGLLHDIGKVYPEESDLPHAILGMELAKKYKEHPDVCNAIGAHHDEIEMTTMISPIVQACDAISGSRPGARREVMEAYLQRLKDLEALALSFEGVNKCYALQAGRELRVLVDAENISDDQASMLSFEIAQKIEREMQYPGQIKVTVIRETRAVNYAK